MQKLVVPMMVTKNCNCQNLPFQYYSFSMVCIIFAIFDTKNVKFPLFSINKVLEENVEFVVIHGMVQNLMKFLEDTPMELSWTLSNLDKKWKSLCRSQQTIKDILNSNCAQITMLRRILHKIVLTSKKI